MPTYFDIVREWRDGRTFRSLGSGKESTYPDELRHPEYFLSGAQTSVLMTFDASPFASSHMAYPTLLYLQRIQPFDLLTFFSHSLSPCFVRELCILIQSSDRNLTQIIVHHSRIAPEQWITWS